MSRIRTFLTIMLPSMISGGILFGVATGDAASGERPTWAAPAPILVAQADPPRKPTRVPAPPAAPVPPAPLKTVPPAPPVPPLREMVKAQLGAARAQIASDPNIPKAMRDKILARLDKVNASVDKRMKNLSFADMDKFGDEMEKMGEEIEAAMEGLDDELEGLGEQIARDVSKSMGKHNFNIHMSHDDDDDDVAELPEPPELDQDDSDLREAISDLKDLAVKPAQRDQITKLRIDSDGKVATAKKQIADLSTKLQTALNDPKTSDADISRMVDQISSQEASIRKARILAWAQARRVLDVAQQKKIEDAAKKKTK